MANEREMSERVKWITHYSSHHQILLVGEGDFSFALSLATAFGFAFNIVATSLDPYDTLINKYKKAKSNLEKLRMLGASLLHGVDATRMRLHMDLRMRKFDRIIFNFPHAGFHGREDNGLMIKKHRSLIYSFFRNASFMLRASGEIHISHKTKAPFCHWNLEDIALENCLELVECVDFRREDYPGYKNKRGDGSRCDESFPLGKSSTFKFRFCGKSKISTLCSFPWSSSYNSLRLNVIETFPRSPLSHNLSSRNLLNHNDIQRPFYSNISSSNYDGHEVLKRRILPLENEAVTCHKRIYHNPCSDAKLALGFEKCYAEVPKAIFRGDLRRPIYNDISSAPYVGFEEYGFKRQTLPNDEMLACHKKLYQNPCLDAGFALGFEKYYAEQPKAIFRGDIRRPIYGDVSSASYIGFEECGLKRHILPNNEAVTRHDKVYRTAHLNTRFAFSFEKYNAEQPKSIFRRELPFLHGV